MGIQTWEASEELLKELEKRPVKKKEESPKKGDDDSKKNADNEKASKSVKTNSSQPKTPEKIQATKPPDNNNNKIEVKIDNRNDLKNEPNDINVGSGDGVVLSKSQ